LRILDNSVPFWGDLEVCFWSDLKEAYKNTDFADLIEIFRDNTKDFMMGAEDTPGTDTEDWRNYIV